MPFYDLRCSNCNSESNIRATISEKTEHLIACPQCGSTDMETIYISAPAYIKGSADSVPACASSSSCGNTGCRFAG